MHEVGSYYKRISKMFNRKQRFDLHCCNAQKEKSEEKTSKFSVYKGIFLAMLSGIFFLSAAMIVKQMINIHPGQLAVYYFVGLLAFSIPEAVKCQENMLGPKHLRWLLIFRGIMGATNLFLTFMAFRYLPLGESAVIIFSAPVFVTVAARIFLKEPCGIFQTFTVFIAIIGIIFATKIPMMFIENSTVYSTDAIYGLAAAIGSLLISICRFIVIRKVKISHHSIIIFNFGWVAIIETVVLTAIIGNFQWHDCGMQSIFIILLAVVGFAGQTTFTMALQCECAGPVSTMIASSEVALIFVLEILLFQNAPDVFSIVGAVLVGLSLIFVGLNKGVSSLPEDSPHCKRLGWILK